MGAQSSAFFCVCKGGGEDRAERNSLSYYI